MSSVQRKEGQQVYAKIRVRNLGFAEAKINENNLLPWQNGFFAKQWN